MAERGNRIVAIIPSYSPDGDQLRALADALAGAGADPYVLANGSRARAAAELHGLAVLDAHSNAGFGPSINWAVRQIGPFDWLLLANDDLEINGAALGEYLANLREGSGARVVHLDPDVARPVPDLAQIFLNISLLARPLERLRRSERPGRATYRSFSCVLVSRSAWERLEGFDERMPFTYEDADFVRRVRAAGGAIAVADRLGVRHERSVTSGRSVRAVLPVATWSAMQYALKWSSSPKRTVKAVLVTALVVRIALAPAARAPFTAHLAGIREAIRAVLGDRQPRLGSYENGSI